MPAPMFTREQLVSIRNEYSSYREASGELSKYGWTKQKAQELGCSFETIKKIIKRLPAKRTTEYWTYQDVQQLRAFVDQGLKDSAIARRMGKSRKSIVRKRLRLGLRTKREAKTVIDRVARLTRLGYYDREIAEDVGFCERAIFSLRKKYRLLAGQRHKGQNIDDRGGSITKGVVYGKTELTKEQRYETTGMTDYDEEL